MIFFSSTLSLFVMKELADLPYHQILLKLMAILYKTNHKERKCFINDVDKTIMPFLDSHTCLKLLRKAKIH